MKTELEKMILKNQFYKYQAANLSKHLKGTKIFMNMVIHDLRNPSNQIKFAIDQALITVEKIQKKTQKLESVYINYINQVKDQYHQLQNKLVTQIKKAKTQVIENEKKQKIYKKNMQE